MRDLGKTSLPEGYAARRDRLAVKVSREDKNLERKAGSAGTESAQDRIAGTGWIPREKVRS